MNIPKNIITLILFICIPAIAVAQTTPTATHNNQLTLQMIGMSLDKGDTASAKKMLADIEGSCLSSTDWHDKYQYWQSKAWICMIARNHASAVIQLQKAYNSYPTDCAVDNELMLVAYNLCMEGEESNLYEQAESIAADVLVRGSYIADSSACPAAIYSFLARAYEHRGDTIMPQHFHQRSQQLGLRYWVNTTHPDSAEIYNRRMDELTNQVSITKRFFSRKSTAYLNFLSSYIIQVSASSNVQETIHLAKMIIKTAKDSMLTHEKCLYEPYRLLVLNYGYIGNIKDAEAIIPEAATYYAQFPDMPFNEAALHYYLGFGLTEGGNYKEGLRYLKLAKSQLSGELRETILPELNKELQLCEEHL